MWLITALYCLIQGPDPLLQTILAVVFKRQSLLNSVSTVPDTQTLAIKETFENKYLRKKSSERLSSILITFVSIHRSSCLD